MRPKRKPRPEELKRYGVDVEHRGKKYGLTVEDKVSEKDGIVESHFKYEPHFRPAGSKSRGNFGTGLKKCLKTCKCLMCRKKRRSKCKK